MTINVLGQNGGKYLVQVKPENVPEGNLGGAGVILQLDKESAEKMLKKHGIDPAALESQPSGDVFQSTLNTVNGILDPSTEGNRQKWHKLLGDKFGEAFFKLMEAGNHMEMFGID